ncbi:MAG: UDP-glucose/GDP-mannose dehydrogenase family protein [Rhizobiales bacterium]|nr:UDP-glucose/GDP-mannose dehydrogenase family protein [Hyphomicrobiales bacterium]
MRIAVLGTGYVGLVSGACFAAWGHDVTGVDIDRARVDRLNAGEVPIFEPGLADCILACRDLGRLAFTTDLQRALNHVDIVFIAVGTPAGLHDGEADLSHVFEAGRQIARALCGPAVIVTKSTVPVGTAERLEAVMREAAPDGDFVVSSNPEFLREGSAIQDFNRPDRVVIGCDDRRAGALLERLYAPLAAEGIRVVTTSRRSAELIKYAANAFLATKIAFINEMADLCEKVNADVADIALGMGLDRRIGADFLKAGPGYGGSCFPKDTVALLRTAQDSGVTLRLVEQTIAANTARKHTLARRLASLLGGSLRGRHIAVLGLTFKAETDDMRDAPAQTLIRCAVDAGATISAYDPAGMDNARRLLPEISFAANPIDCATGADALVVMTDWACFRTLDLARTGEVMRRRVIMDLRGLYDVDQLVKQYRFTVDRVGMPLRSPERSSRITLNPHARRQSGALPVHNGFRNLETSDTASAMPGGSIPREEFVNEHNQTI